MGTKALVHVKNTNGQTLVTIYRHFDGYPSGLGRELVDFAKDMRITNGISGDATGTANGMGCFAAQLVVHLKTKYERAGGSIVGNVYLCPPDACGVGEDYTYTIELSSDNKLILTVTGDETVYTGELADNVARLVGWQDV